MFDYSLIINGIIEGDAQTVQQFTKQALREKYPPDKILERGLIAGINIIAEKFKTERVLVPEVLRSTRAMHAGMAELQPYLKIKPNTSVKAVLGTVAGDLHDIGKFLVNMLVSSVGVTVIDLGVNVSPKKFVDAVRRERPVFLMMSALLTTTMWDMKEVIDELISAGLREQVKVIVGGTPITVEFAREIGADYYFEDAFELKNFLQDNFNKLKNK